MNKIRPDRAWDDYLYWQTPAKDIININPPVMALSIYFQPFCFSSCISRCHMITHSEAATG